MLPAPLTHRHNLDDPTVDFETMATPEARLRIGLAHSSIMISDRKARPTARSHPTAPNVQISTISLWRIGTASSISAAVLGML